MLKLYLEIFDPERKKVFQKLKDFDKNLLPLIKTNSLSLSSIEDIAANKAFTIGQRGAWRDYVDLFTLLKNRVFSLEKIIQLAKKKYHPEFSDRQFLEQLCYFGDIANFKITYLKNQSHETKEIQNFLLAEVKKYKNKILTIT